jgi:tetratricopeptide (TPR) repeat protein
MVPDAPAGQAARTGWLQAARTMHLGTRSAVAVGCVMAVAIGIWALLTRTTAGTAPHEQAAHYAVLGRALMDREHTARANKEALVLFDKALALDPNSTLALLGYARVMLVDVTDGWAPPEEHAARLNQAEAAIERAIKLDPKHARSYLLRGFLWRARGDRDRALTAFQDALTLDSNYAWAWAETGRTKIDIGRADEAMQDIERAIRLAPSEPRLHNWYYWLGMAAVHAGQSDIAVHWLLKGREDDALYYRLAMPWLAIAYADLGREDDGRTLMAQYLAKHPTYALAGWSKAFPRLNPRVAAQRDRIAEVLRRLGVPDSNLRTGSVR